MSLFDFVKEAGKILGVGPGVAPTAEALKKELDSHNIGSGDLKVDVQGDKAVLSGVAKDQTVLEKAVIAIGNTIGISKVETDVKVAEANTDGASQMYTVKKGDTLWEIAEAVYGKGKGAHNKDIFEANRPMLKKPDKIYPGQVLRIPALAEKRAA